MKLPAYGTELWMDGSMIAQVLSLTGPSLTAEVADVTEHDGSGWEEVVVTILRTGELTCEIAYDPAIHASLITALETKALGAFELRFPDTAYTAFEFDAYVVTFEPSMPVDDALKASLSFKITGEPTLTATYSP